MLHVVDDFFPPCLAEVDIEVGRGDALGVQETLKNELVAQRVDLRDAQCVGHETATAGASPRAHRDAVRVREMDEIPYHQEIVDEPGLFDDGQFLFETRHHLALAVVARVHGIREVVVLLDAFVCQVDQVLLLIHAIRTVKGGEVKGAEFHLEVAAVRDLKGQVHGAREFTEQRFQLLACLQVEFFARVPHALRV